MKTFLIIGLVAFLANSLWAASPKEQVTAAAKSLGEKANYSGTTTPKAEGGNPGRNMGPIEGKAEKDGYTYLLITPGGISVEVVMKGEKGAAKTLEGWQSFQEIEQAGGSGASISRRLRKLKTPSAEAAEFVAKTKDLQEADGAYAGELTEDGVKERLLLEARRREGQEAPQISGAKGSVKFWLKDGALVKYEVTLQGKLNSGDREIEINRTVTVEIKDVGSTKIDVPAEALKSLS